MSDALVSITITRSASIGDGRDGTSGTASGPSRSGRGRHSVNGNVPPVCAPSTVTLITPAGGSGSRQSLFAEEVKPPYVTVSPPTVSVRPVGDAPPGPQLSSSLLQPASAAMA